MENFFNTHADIYDSHMLDDLKLAEFYETISGCFSTPIGRLLDLGCGTGLELDLLFKRFPDMEVTGIELSAEMLKKLGEKYPDKKLNLICGSYFDEDFGGTYDCVLSTYSLHHFAEDKKLALYQKIHTALKQDGFFVFGDYIVKTAEQQQALLIENENPHHSAAVFTEFPLVINLRFAAWTDHIRHPLSRK